MTSVAERYFAEDLRVGTDRLRREIGYNPTYFNRMVAEYGPVEACRRLIRADAVSDGFTKLWEHNRLDMTVEALSLLPWYNEVFDDDVRDHARRKLTAHRFDVDAFLANRTASPPRWTISP
ncbi:MAG: hypothetical protein ACRDYY_07585 [Acidimicrobiales bacterium]